MAVNDDYDFFSEPDPILATVASLFSVEGAAREVAVLAIAQETMQVTDTAIAAEGYRIISFYTLYLHVPTWFYPRISAELDEIETRIFKKISDVLRPFPDDDGGLERVAIVPIVTVDAKWREKALAWLAGEGVSNQGRVRSDNLPTRSADGLLFRSQPEICLYQALKSKGVSFAPLPVFIRGGETYQRIEPDFVIVHDGITMVVEVDGDTVHHETPAEAHARTTMLAVCRRERPVGSLMDK